MYNYFPRNWNPFGSIDLSDFDSAQDGSDSHHDGDSFWVPAGKSIKTHGYIIPDGMIYFGKGLQSVSKWDTEPALINPSLKVQKGMSSRECLSLDYYGLSYKNIHPDSRAAYLQWLSDSKEDPAIDICYVKLYFTGLERRALYDVSHSRTARKDDLPLILEEVERLIRIYGKHEYFKHHAGEFLDAIRLPGSTKLLYKASPKPVAVGHFEPVSLKMALGQLARDGVPLSPEWALAWAENVPFINWRTPKRRCPVEFQKLFSIRYLEKYPEGGIVLKKNRARVKITYYPVSSSFNNSVQIPLKDLPDATRTRRPLEDILKIIYSCIDELDLYSRHMGRNPESANTLDSISYLPAPLLLDQFHDGGNKLVSLLNESPESKPPLEITFQALMSYFPSIKKVDINKKTGSSLANILAAFHIGLEPDPRFGSPTLQPDQPLYLFPVEEPPSLEATVTGELSDDFSRASVILHLMAILTISANQDRFASIQQMDNQIKSWNHLTNNDQLRLKGYARSLLFTHPGYGGVKKRLSLFEQNQKESLRLFLVEIARTGGTIGKGTMDELKRIYKFLGLKKSAIYSDAHQAAAKPVTVETFNHQHSTGFSIPAPSRNMSSAISLDQEALIRKRKESAAGHERLREIFREEEEAIESEPAPEKNILNHQSDIPGLDEDLFKIVKLLIEHPKWSRRDLENLAAQHDFMLDGALEAINDVSFKHFDAPLFEGDDPIEINRGVVEELL